LARRRLIWIPIFLIVLVIAVTTYFSSPVTYRSSTKVLIRRGERESTLNSRVRVVSWQEELASEVQTVFSDIVLQRADSLLAEEGVRTKSGRPLEIQPGQISARPIEGSNVLLLLYQNREPELAKKGVEALTRAYVEFRNYDRAAPEVEGFFRGEIASIQDALRDLTQQRRQILVDAGLASFTEQRQETVDLYGSVRQALIQASDEVAYESARLEAFRRLREEGVAGGDYVPVLGSDESRNDVEIRRLVDQLAELKIKANELRSRYTDDHPFVSEVLDQIEGQRELIQEGADRYERALEAQLIALEARESHLRSQVLGLTSELDVFPGREAELTDVNMQIAALEDNYRQLLNEYMAAGIQTASSPSRAVTPYALASSPIAVRTGDLIRTLVLPLFALVVAFGLAFIVDSLDPTVKTAREAERILGAPVLASVTRDWRR
jgi:uncharacterized protein involved in exopolysaccharide biosynthesis